MSVKTSARAAPGEMPFRCSLLMPCSDSSLRVGGEVGIRRDLERQPRQCRLVAALERDRLEPGPGRQERAVLVALGDDQAEHVGVIRHLPIEIGRREGGVSDAQTSIMAAPIMSGAPAPGSSARRAAAASSSAPSRRASPGRRLPACRCNKGRRDRACRTSRRTRSASECRRSGSLVLLSCRFSSLTCSVNGTSAGLGNSSAVIIHGPEHGVAVDRLAEAAVLLAARGHVEAERIAGDVVPGLLLRDIAALLADDHARARPRDRCGGRESASGCPPTGRPARCWTSGRCRPSRCPARTAPGPGWCRGTSASPRCAWRSWSAPP